MKKLQIKYVDVVKTLFRLPLLRYTLFISMAISVFLPAYGNFFIYPQFNKQLKDYTEDTAIRVANHLKSRVTLHGKNLTEHSFTQEVVKDVMGIVKNLDIEKIKIFSQSGIVLFSTDTEDIGQKNRHSYFYDYIAKGNTYSKVVDENTKTMEGRTVDSKVVESYIPLMASGEFKGAVEVYYDITKNGKTLTTLISKLNISIWVVSVLFFTLLMVILFKAGRNTLIKELAEKALRAAHEKLEKAVDERTADLKRTNQSLIHEIEERTCTEDSLQKSYDTQKIINELLQESLQDSPLEDIMDLCLDLVISLPWLSFESMGCIFLVGEDPDVLIMKAQTGLSAELEALCSNVAFGQCLCGRAAKKQETVFASNIDPRHDLLLPGTPDHGHYCVPMTAKGKTLGVINIYVKPGHNKNEMEIAFLKTVANALSGILIQRYGEKQKQEIEKRLNQSHKMEAIGTLAGGIAHDFNNILSGIIGHAQLTSMNLDNPDKATSHIDQIHNGAKRATDLIQQILTFSRQTEHDKKPVRLYLVIKEALKFIRSSFPSNIRISEEISSREMVKADPTQMHQVLMNLCTNAYHAMQETGGELSVRLSEVAREPEDTPADDKWPAKDHFLKLEVSDTGMGIPRKIRNKIFEPYFTTKKIGEGTGLGLAAVLGIVEGHGGRIHVESEPGSGTSIQIYLPILKERTERTDSVSEKIKIQGGDEKIMVVDDENSILEYYSDFLERYGYQVKAFSGSVGALKTFQQDPDGYDLLITDMTMPDMTGDVLAAKVLEIRKDFPIILCTGYSKRLSKSEATIAGIRKYHQKPVEGNDLLHSIRTLLDQ